MATTTNYGWTTPDDTDLVKNGASAIRSLGTSVDTAVWNAGYTAGKNAVINGGFDIWQRGTSSTSANYSTADRWWMYFNSGTGTFAQESTTVPSGSQYALKFTASSTASVFIAQAIETANSLRFAGQTVTFSGKVAASTSVPITLYVQYSTSTDNAVGGSWTTITATSGGTATPTSTTYVPISGVYAIPSTAKTIRVGFGTTSTISTSVVVYFGQFQLEAGSTATPFQTATGTKQGELAACQRYLPAFNFAADFFNGYAQSTTLSYYVMPFPVQARVAPTGITVGSVSSTKVNNYLNANGSPTAIAFDSAGRDSGRISVTTTAGTPTLVAANPSSFYISADTTFLFTGCEL